jgi:thiamine pyrophosphokinase
MPRALIFANGDLRHLDHARALARPTNLLIAADGGLRHLTALGWRPHALIGDLDSAEGDWAALAAQGVHIERHSPHKDETDLELAVRWAIAHGAEEAIILGALGGRWDQTMANVLLLANPAWSAFPVRIVDGPQTLTLARDHLILPGAVGDTVSLIPLGGSARGVTTHGLLYPLAHGDLPFGATLGVSNVITALPASITVHDGIVLCVVIHKND